MSEYKRLTKWETSKGVKCVKYWQYSQEQIAERLALLEDKIENGTLVEFNKPFYSNQLNAWCIYLREGDYITSLCLTKEQAEEYQKKLQEELENANFNI